MRQELVFAARLPDGARVRERVESRSQAPPDFWTNTAFDERELHGSIEALRYLGTPNWAVRAVLATRAFRIGLMAVRRRLKSR